MPGTVKSIVEAVKSVKTSEERIVLVVGEPGSGKSKVLRELSAMQGWKYVDSKLLFTDSLLELIPELRADEA